MSFSLLVAPTSTPDRTAAIAEVCRGFVYVLARLGLTGDQGAIPDIEDHIRNIRAITDLPLAVGFGFSSA